MPLTRFVLVYRLKPQYIFLYSNIPIYVYPTGCNITVYFIWKLLYMFRVVPSPIIRSANNYLQHLVFVTQLLLSAAIVEELKLNVKLFLFIPPWR